MDLSNAQSCIIGILMMMFGYGVRSKFKRHELIEDICIVTVPFGLPITIFYKEIYSFFKYFYSLSPITVLGIKVVIWPLLLSVLLTMVFFSIRIYWDSKYKKDKKIGWHIHSITGKVICSVCWEKPRFKRFKSFLCKDITGLFKRCPKCKTVYALPLEMVLKEDFAEDFDIKATDRRPRKKAMRVSTLK
jgi:hypothetical protein